MSQRTRADWASGHERGSRFGLGLLVWLIRRLGKPPLRMLLAPLATYYNLFGGSAKRARRP